MNALLYFPRKQFQLRHSKICKNLKNALDKRTKHWLLSFRRLQNHFLRSFLWPNFDLNCFERFAWLFQKMVSTLPLKNLQKTEECPFQMLRTFVFELKVASKPFSEMLNLTNFGFKTLCLAFTVSGFNFLVQKFAKNWILLFSKAQNLCF